ncbi:Toluene efflux pump outer membrane protein TtgC [bioreactor metagenome]|jgi:outer membrane protein|uniref:Toluene efflux pump outer membrane protein TtgC n=1 Tax=bioreactor metagenome TaxID=1076179 RepID=A0A644WB44_9ZZZZ|nr:TolC family protein [Paludibacter sp.]
MKKLLYIGVLMLLATLNMSAKKIYTLQQCVDTALQNNRNVKQQDFNRQSKAIAYEQARMDLLPNLNASAGQSFMLGRSLIADNTYRNVNSSQTSFNISSGITLFDGMKMKYNIDARKAEMKASEADLEKIKSDIELNVTVAFLQVLLYKENLQTLEAQLELTKQKIEQKTALVNAGKQPEGELYELKAQLAKEELNLTQAKNNHKLALLDLAQIIELDNFEDFDVEIPGDVMITEQQLLSAEDVYRSAVQNRPEIKGAEYRLQSNMKNADIARSAFFPSLSFGAQVGTGYYNLSGTPNDAFNKQLNDNLSTNVGFSLQIPIFNRFEVKNRVSASKIAIESSKLDIENVKLELRKTIQQAYQNALAAQARYTAAQKSEIASKEAYRYAEQKYEAGKASVYELYQAKSNLTQVLSELSQSKYEYVLRIKVLELLK